MRRIIRSLFAGVALVSCSLVVCGCSARVANPAVFVGLCSGDSSGSTAGQAEFEFIPGSDPATSAAHVTFRADGDSELYVKGAKVPEGLVSFMARSGPGSHAPAEVFTLTPDTIEYVESDGAKLITALRVP